MISTHVDDQIAAYAFGALTGEERRRVEGHLEECPACAERAEQAAGLAGLLPYSVPPIEAPPEIKQELFRLLGEHATADGHHPDQATVEAQPPAWARPEQQSRRATLLLRTVPWTAAAIGWLVAAALLIYSHGQSDRLRTGTDTWNRRLAAAAAQLGQTQQQLSAALTVQGYLTTPHLVVLELKYMAGVARHTSVALVMAPHYAHALLVARGLAVLPAPRVYVAWARAKSGPYVRLGTLTTGGPRAEGMALVVGRAPLEQYAEVGISIEPASGAARPTTPLIFRAPLHAASG